MVKEEKKEIYPVLEVEVIPNNNYDGYCIELIEYNVILEKDGYLSWTSYADKESFDKEKNTLEKKIIQEGVAPSFAEYYCRKKNRENDFI